jgi:hypothetical protein
MSKSGRECFALGIEAVFWKDGAEEINDSLRILSMVQAQ